MDLESRMILEFSVSTDDSRLFQAMRPAYPLLKGLERGALDVKVADATYRKVVITLTDNQPGHYEEIVFPGELVVAHVGTDPDIFSESVFKRPDTSKLLTYLSTQVELFASKAPLGEAAAKELVEVTHRWRDQQLEDQGQSAS